MGPTRSGLAPIAVSEGEIGFSEFWRVPVNEGLIVLFVPGLDVTD
jgi:hypothetical protein